MDNLYDFNLFTQDYVIEKISNKLILQLLIQIDKGQYIKVLMFQAQNADQNVTLLMLDENNKKIGPIYIDYLPLIIESLKSVPFPEKLGIVTEELSFVSVRKIERPVYMALSDQITALVTSESTPTIKMDIEVELISNKKLAPKKFSFAAFDGIDMNIQFELSKDLVQNIYAWGILSKIGFYINGIPSGDYYAINTTANSNGSITFLCKTKIVSVLDRKMMIKTHMDGFNIYEISDFLVSSAGLYNCVTIPEDYLEIRKWFTIIIPIIGLQIADEFGIGSVEFCLVQNENIQRALEFENELKLFETYALVHINSEKMYSAYEQGKRQIEQSLDLLVNILKDDSLLSGHSLGHNFCNRSIDCFEIKVGLSHHIYIESSLSGARFSFNFSEPKNSSQIIATQQLLPERTVLDKLELLLIKANGTNDEEITPLFNSLKWIRKAWDSDNYEDQIINVVIALEFIVSKEKSDPLLNKGIRKKCASAIESIVRNDLEVDDRFIEVVISTFHRSYTEAPFMNKLENLIKRLNIPVSNEELLLIRSARAQRNGIIHGKNDMLMPSDDIYRLCECISRIAFYKIFSLEE